MKILITGGSGLVGSAISQKLSSTYEVLTPDHQLLDITSKAHVDTYVSHFKPDVVIHAAAFTDMAAAEIERGDKKGRTWKTNVEGTRNIDKAVKRIGAFHIFISTGSVFSGDKNEPGPFTENNKPPSDSLKLTWYGWTKRRAEIEVDGAVIRISHPVKKEGPGVERDYIHNLLNLYKKGRLYALFTDQFFPITWMDDLTQVIEKLIESPRKGVFHVASPDLVSPYTLMQYAVSSGPGPASLAGRLGRGVIDPLRFTQYCAIDSRKTQKKLGLHFKTWKESVDLLW